jgi:hypothetical protein
MPKTVAKPDNSCQFSIPILERRLNPGLREKPRVVAELERCDRKPSSFAQPDSRELALSLSKGRPSPHQHVPNQATTQLLLLRFYQQASHIVVLRRVADE